MIRFLTTVIIPVYNAELYLAEAVESVVHYEEVAQVLLIEDNSPDNALVVANSLADLYAKVEVLQHPNGENRGAGASRNLGIQAARTDWITFLDADDVASSHRFDQIKLLLAKNDSYEAVYEAVGTLDSRGIRNLELNLSDASLVTMVKQPVQPKELFDNMAPMRRAGGISTIGVTAKRAALLELGGFDEKLRVSQDTLMWLRLAARGNFVGGAPDVIAAYRRIHAGNRGRVSVNHQMYRSLLFGMLALQEQGYKLSRKRKAKVLTLSLIHATKTRSLRRANNLTWIWRRMPRKQLLSCVSLMVQYSPSVVSDLFRRSLIKVGTSDA